MQADCSGYTITMAFRRYRCDGSSVVVAADSEQELTHTMRILLLTPPLTQLNTPYPATAYLKGLFADEGHEVRQVDLGIEVVDRVLSYAFLQGMGMEREARLIEPVKRFLRGQDDTLGPRIANRTLLPEGKRFGQLDEEQMEWSFGVGGPMIVSEKE